MMRAAVTCSTVDLYPYISPIRLQVLEVVLIMERQKKVGR